MNFSDNVSIPLNNNLNINKIIKLTYITKSYNITCFNLGSLCD